MKKTKKILCKSCKLDLATLRSSQVIKDPSKSDKASHLFCSSECYMDYQDTLHVNMSKVIAEKFVAWDSEAEYQKLVSFNRNSLYK